jgi:hypothetical protein
VQLNRDLVGYHFSKRPEVVLEAPDKPFDFAWPQPEVLRAAGASGSLMQLREVSYTYPGAAAPVLHVSPGPCLALCNVMHMVDSMLCCAARQYCPYCMWGTGHCVPWAPAAAALVLHCM